MVRPKLKDPNNGPDHNYEFPLSVYTHNPWGWIRSVLPKHLPDEIVQMIYRPVWIDCHNQASRWWLHCRQAQARHERVQRNCRRGLLIN